MHVIRDVRRRLFGFAESAGVEATEAQVDAFLTMGSQQRWLDRQVDRGKLRSPLHAWCARDRWLAWLRKAQGRTHATIRDSDVDAVRRERADVRREIARQAQEYALGRMPFGKGKP